MPFCRECGKGVEEDWVTCPFCSQPIGPPAARVAEISDSVVMGNLNVNDSKSISTAVKSAAKCPSCGSIGTTQIACTKCKNISYCHICEDEVKGKIADKVKFTSTYADEERNSKCTIIDSRICLECVDEMQKCLCCENSFKSRETTKNRENSVQFNENWLKKDPHLWSHYGILSIEDYNNRKQKSHEYIIQESWLSPNIVCDTCFHFYVTQYTKKKTWYKKAKNAQTIYELM